MKKFVFILFTLFSIGVSAQSSLDLLYQSISTAKNDEESIKATTDFILASKTTNSKEFKTALNHFFKLLDKKQLDDKNIELRLLVAKNLIYLGDFINSEKLIRDVLDDVPDVSKENLKARCYRRLSQVQSYQGKRIEVIALLDSAILFVANNEVVLKADLVMEKGRVYYDMGNYSDAMKYYLISKKTLDDIGVKGREYANLMHFMGSVFKRQNNDEKALEYYQKMLVIALDIKDSFLEAEAYDLIAGQYAYLGNYEKETEYITKALNLYISLGDLHGEALTLLNIVHGNIYDKKYKEALVKLNRVQEITSQLNIKEYNVIINRYYGNIYAKMKNHSKALSYFKKSIEAANAREEKRILHLTDIYRNMAYAYYKNTNYKDAYDYLDLHMLYKDSLINEENQNIIHELEQQYENQKKESEIIALNKDKEISEKELSKQNVVIKSFVIGFVLALLLIITVSYSLTQNKKKNKIISNTLMQVEEKNQEIMDSIAYAKRIQTAILPPKKIVKEYLNNSFIYYQPKDIVAGDFYWLEHKDNKVLFAAADCTGHGVPGAMVSVICNNGLNRSVREYGLTDPGEILNKTREIVIQEFEKSEEEVKDGMDIALCSLEGNTLRYAGAHNPLWIIRNQELIETKANKQPIGKFDNLEPYTTHTLELQKGDSIYIFSDGYADQFGGEKGKKLKTANFKKLLFSIQDQPMDKQRKLIEEAFEKWKGNLEQLDDVCVIGVKI